MLAGRVGMQPDGMTLTELAQAAEGRDRAEWAKLAALEAFVASSMSGKRVSPAQYDPYRRAAKRGHKGIRYVVNGVEVTSKTFDKMMEATDKKVH